MQARGNVKGEGYRRVASYLQSNMEGRGMEEWTKSVIVTLQKKGYLSQCSNYRTIVLISHVGKVLNADDGVIGEVESTDRNALIRRISWIQERQKYSAP